MYSDDIYINLCHNLHMYLSVIHMCIHAYVNMCTNLELRTYNNTHKLIISLHVCAVVVMCAMIMCTLGLICKRWFPGGKTHHKDVQLT